MHSHPFAVGLRKDGAPGTRVFGGGWGSAVRFANAHLIDDEAVAKMGHPGDMVVWSGNLCGFGWAG